MKVLLIESCEKLKVDKSSSIVHVRNSILIKDTLGWDFVHHESQIKDVIGNRYDAIVCAYASPYMMYQQYLEILILNPQAKIFWMINDHDVEDNILLRRWMQATNKQYHMICNNPREGYRPWILNKKLNEKTLNDWIDEWHTVNLNCLIFDQERYEETANFHDREGIVYYGTHRPYRIKDMLKYNGSGYCLSSSRKNHLKFKRSGVQGRYIEKMLWEEKEPDMFEPVGLRLKDFLVSLYFEDEHTHSNYAFMANRFYEGLMCNTLMVYDKSCQSTIDQSSFDIHPMQIVENTDQLVNLTEQLSTDRGLYRTLLSVQQSNVPKVLLEQENAYKAILKALT